jgi:hypothetical protein
MKSSLKVKIRSFVAAPYKVGVSIAGVRPLEVRQRLQGLGAYLGDCLTYSKARLPQDAFKITLQNLHPCLDDRYDSAGSTSGDYFHQDLWVARQIFAANPREHWDIGSRIDGFISHLLTFRAVNVIDIRPLESKVSGLTFHQGNITALTLPDQAIESLSCLHTMEHIGLGRYGDPIDPLGCFKGMIELQRVLKPGGKLYFSVPIGRERVEFNAHRIFDPLTILSAFSALKLVDFVAVNGAGDFVDRVQPEDFRAVHYACGIFTFEKPV